MNIGKVEIPPELEPVFESAQQLGLQILDTTECVVLDCDNKAHDYRQAIRDLAELHETGTYLSGYDVLGYFLCQHLGFREEECDQLGDRIDDLSLIILCPAGKEQELGVGPESAVIVFLPAGHPQA